MWGSGVGGLGNERSRGGGPRGNMSTDSSELSCT